MSRTQGKMNAGRIKNSRRLQRIVAVLKEAAHPLSAEEIARRAYEFDTSGRIMLNVSTNIGEMRSDENRADGYNVSFSTIWKPGHPAPGMRENRDKSVTFFVERKTMPWHDGRPRYWLAAAPGWTPRWTVAPDGHVRPARPGAAPGSTLRTPYSTLPDGDRCHYPPCNAPIPPERAAEGAMTCSDEHSEAWRKM